MKAKNVFQVFQEPNPGLVLLSKCGAELVDLADHGLVAGHAPPKVCPVYEKKKLFGLGFEDHEFRVRVRARADWTGSRHHQ